MWDVIDVWMMKVDSGNQQMSEFAQIERISTRVPLALSPIGAALRERHVWPKLPF
jgi:hypothetical protein